MYGNTPPYVSDIDGDDAEIVEFEDDELPPDEDDDYDTMDDGLELEEVSLEELEARLLDVAEREDNAKYTFRGHTGPVFSCSLHQQHPWAATGGQDDTVYMWHTETGDILHKIEDHNDTVISLHFNHDGVYLASGDMAGGVFVHKLHVTTAEVGIPREPTNGVTIRKVCEYQMGDMSWMRWHRAANVLLAGSASGEVYVWRIPSGECKILPGEGVSCDAGELTHDGRKLLTSYNNGVVKLWDLKSCKVLLVVPCEQPNSEYIVTLACNPSLPLYMAGSEDGELRFISNNGPVGKVNTHKTVETVAFSPSKELKMAASGSLKGRLAIWDYGKFDLRLMCDFPEVEDGITKLKWLNDYTLLVVTLQGYVYGYDARSGIRMFTLSGHLEDIYDFSYNAQQNVLLTVSEDSTAKYFQLPQLAE